MTDKTHRDSDATNKLQIVRSFYDYLDEGDVPGVLGLMHPAISWTEAESFPYYAGTSIGPDAVLNNLLKPLAAEWTSFAAIPKEFLIEGSTIVSLGNYEGTYKRTGKSMYAGFAHVWTVDDGRITSHLAFTDTAKVLAALAP